MQLFADTQGSGLDVAKDLLSHLNIYMHKDYPAAMLIHAEAPDKRGALPDEERDSMPSMALTHENPPDFIKFESLS